jgi:hypothetical protein
MFRFLAAASIAVVLGAAVVAPSMGQSARRIYIPVSQHGFGAGAELELLSSSSYVDSAGDLHVQGEVRNRASWPQGPVEIGLTFVGPSGSTLGTTFGFALLDTVDSGQTTPFNVTVEGAPSGYSEIGLLAEGVSAPAVGARLAVEGASGALDSEGYYQVTGQLRNGSGATVVDPTAVVTLYDADGAVVAAGVVAPAASSLAPGASSPFDFSFLPRGTVASFKVVGQTSSAGPTRLTRNERAGEKPGKDGEKGPSEDRDPTETPPAPGSPVAGSPTASVEPTVERGENGSGGGHGKPERVGRPEDDDRGRGKRDGRDGAPADKPDRKGESVKVAWEPRRLEGSAAPGETFSGAVQLSATRGGPVTAQLVVWPRSRARFFGGAADGTATPTAVASGTPTGSATPSPSVTASPSATGTSVALASRGRAGGALVKEVGVTETPTGTTTAVATGTATVTGTTTPPATGTAVPGDDSSPSGPIGSVTIPASGSVSVPITVTIPSDFRGRHFNAEVFVKVGRSVLGRPLKVRIEVTRPGSPTGTVRPVASGTVTAVASDTVTPTATLTPVASGTVTPSVTATPTATPTETGTATATVTATATP